MEITYSVEKYDHVNGVERILSSQQFDSVNDAIDYHRKQSDTDFSWWEIKVKYKD